jgi:hypothetical protein
MMELKTNKTFTKWLRKKIKNHKNKDWIEKKKYMANWNWMTKLKTNKTFIKGSKTKKINKKNKDWNWNTKNR